VEEHDGGTEQIGGAPPSGTKEGGFPASAGKRRPERGNSWERNPKRPFSRISAACRNITGDGHIGELQARSPRGGSKMRPTLPLSAHLGLLLPLLLLGALLLLPPASAQPQVTVTSPEEGEVWWGTENAVWVATASRTENARFTVYLSLDGVSWVQVGSLENEVGPTPGQFVLPINTVVYQDTDTARIKVVASDAAGEAEALSPTFRIKNTVSPPAPYSPADRSTTRRMTPTLSWEEASGPVAVVSYTVQVAADRGFSEVVYSKTVSSTSVTVERVLQDGWYYWRVKARDSRGVESAWSKTFSFEVYTLAPTILSVSLEGEARWTSRPTVQLEIEAVNVREMSLSPDGVTWSDWIPYSQTHTYAVPGGDGPKRVYVRGRDATGRVSDVSAVDFLYDTTPPVTVHSISGTLGSGGYRGSAVVTLLAVDLGAGVENTVYRVDGGEWRAGTQFVVAEDGDHLIEYYSTDKAGNAEPIKSLSLTVYTPFAPVPYLGIALLAAGGLGAGWYMRASGMRRVREWRNRRRLHSEWFRQLVEWDRVLERRERLRAEGRRRRR